MFGPAMRFPVMCAILHIALVVNCLGQPPPAAESKSDVTRLSQLIAIVEANDHPDCDLAIRALADLKTQASPAIPALCKLLDDAQHGTRASAVDALVAIGNDSVRPLRELMLSPSGRCRAAAVTALGRLGQLQSDNLEQLATDTDARVRCAAAQAFVQLGESGATRLVSLLGDSEESVAVEAARGLTENHADSAAAIESLTKTLSRPHVGWAAADTLSSYGVQAQRAVPWIIKAYPLGESRESYWDDAAEDALEHIGPPHPDDIPLLIECLSHNELEAQILAADSLAMLGTTGKSAARGLESIVDATLNEPKAEAEPEADDADNSGFRDLVFVGRCVNAIWKVTRDPERFLTVTQKVALTDSVIPFEHPRPWEDLPVDSYPSIETMLRHPNSSVRWTALYGIADFGPRAKSFQSALLALVDDPEAEISNTAMSALANTGPGAADVTGPRLLERFRAGKIPLKEFAWAAGRLRLRSPEVGGILTSGLRDPNQGTREACARAIVDIADDPDWSAKYLIAAVDKHQINERFAIEILCDLDVESDLVVKFLTRQLGNSDFWTRHDAVDALASMGERAKPVIANIEGLLQDQQIVVQLQAAKAIALIAGETKFLEERLRSIFAASDWDTRKNRGSAIETIGQLKQMGNVYVHYLLDELHSNEPLFASEAIEALEAIGTPDAVAAIRTVAESNDWALRSSALEALDRLAMSRTKD